MSNLGNKDKRLLILIPARGGSKGIPQKNMVMLNNKPLVSYAIENARSFEDAEIYVVTDDDRIEEIALLYKVGVLRRPASTATDLATIDDVVSYAFDLLEKDSRKRYDTVITLQPTSPLLKNATLRSAYKYFTESKTETLISVGKKYCLFWYSKDGTYLPFHEKRVNRQQLPPIYIENGAFLICSADNIRHHKKRIAGVIEIFPVEEAEGLDIDTKDDLGFGELLSVRKKIALVANGDPEVGMGHIYRCLTLSDKLNAHNTNFYSQKKSQMGINKLLSLNYPVSVYEDLDGLVDMLVSDGIEIVVNDVLDTGSDYIQALKRKNIFSVNFEDVGVGALECDLLFNALYEWSGSQANRYYGYKYECLRSDIYFFPIKRDVPEKVKKVLISFGGVDHDNLTLKILKGLNNIGLEEIDITVITGVGYTHYDELEKFACYAGLEKIVRIHRDISMMAKYIFESDMVICGNGRTVYEVVSMGTPIIVCSQNDRELSHIFPKICPGVKYFGNIKGMNDDELSACLSFVRSSYQERKESNEYLVRYAVDLRNGLDRVMDIIWKTYHGKFGSYEY